ncbi:MAG: phosphatidylserine/phosphatidylglycerophosphate/cardiolipin synthase family protein [Synechococcaceae cyanobacterium]|nr:phosphatidylserine/phosphatidylglycerophosphate/cardiolipin synthase family protein [Synechococcaceae cyanobacterium]
MVGRLVPALVCGGTPWLLLCLSSCGPSQARLSGGPAALPPLPEGIQLVFNHRLERHYRSPVSGNWRQGDDLEKLLIDTVRSARREIQVAVQELSLPQLAEALVERQRQGVRVRVVLENNYSQPWSAMHPAGLAAHQQRRLVQLRALGQGDAVAILQQAGVPMLDDTADGSAGSGLMHHKFLIVDGRWLVTGSANFTPSCIHGDPDDPRSRGNVNHLLRFDSPELAKLFGGEFERMWGDGPGGRPDSRFGLGKAGSGPKRVRLGNTTVEVLFAPHRRSDPQNGLLWLQRQLNGVQRRLDLSLFVFSAQNLADSLAELRQRGVAIRLLTDPGFSHRSFSEALDLLGVELPDHRCALEANNRPWKQPLASVGTPRLAGGDKLHHKFAVLDRRRVISGSFNWSPSAAHQNDETLLLIDSKPLALAFEAEMNRLWRGAELGSAGRLERRRQRQRLRCGDGRRRAGIRSPLATTTVRIRP